MKINELGISDGLPVLTELQWRFVAARLQTKTDRQAAAEVGIDPATVSRWPNRRAIKELILLLRQDAAAGAVALLEQRSLNAAMTIVASMDSPDPAVRLRAAQDVLDRTLGKALQRSEMSGAISVREETDDLSDEEIDRRIGSMARAALAAFGEAAGMEDVETTAAVEDSAGEE